MLMEPAINAMMVVLNVILKILPYVLCVKIHNKNLTQLVFVKCVLLKIVLLVVMTMFVFNALMDNNLMSMVMLVLNVLEQFVLLVMKQMFVNNQPVLLLKHLMLLETLVSIVISLIV